MTIRIQTVSGQATPSKEQVLTPELGQVRSHEHLSHVTGLTPKARSARTYLPITPSSGVISSPEVPNTPRCRGQALWAPTTVSSCPSNEGSTPSHHISPGMGESRSFKCHLGVIDETSIKLGDYPQHCRTWVWECTSAIPAFQR